MQRLKDSVQVASKKLTPANFRARLRRLCPPTSGQTQHFALAVSGGADSLSLLVLAAGAKTERLTFTVLTFDHQLRPGSSDEADAVCQTANKYGLPFHKLSWAGPKPRASLQSAARDARYQAMLGWCANHGTDGLIVAHHLEDQAETFLLRLARGSGLDGLTAMRAVSNLKNGVVIRPFLDVRQVDLHAVLQGQDVTPVDDPSNADARHQRIAFRQNKPLFDTLGLTSARLADTAQTLQKARDVLDALTEESLTRLVVQAPCGVLSFDRSGFRSLPEDIGIRVLRRVLAMHRPYPPRQSSISQLYQFISGKQTGRRTVAGQIVSVKQALVQVFREPADIETTPLAVSKGRKTIWDGRFEVTVSRKATGRYVVMPLGVDGLEWARNKGLSLPKHPAKVLHGLACVCKLGAGKRPGKPLAIADILTHPGIFIDTVAFRTENID
ncbi:MAG: tRNA lysidine(34) synthetase TilS [Parvibaculales bacterium]